uniref:phosphatidylinositol-3,5-bisphosphate 3-phosphatase n=1 Tax=Knipowitschia caucasica TaxID=637954 RepID=A0AAV2J8G7_KNICA
MALGDTIVVESTESPFSQLILSEIYIWLCTSTRRGVEREGLAEEFPDLVPSHWLSAWVKRGLPVWSTSRQRTCSHRRNWSKRMRAYRCHSPFSKFTDSIINSYQSVDNEISVPLRLIESVESRDMFNLHIICKDSKIVRCNFATFKQCQEWVKRLNRAIAHPSRLEELFALAFHAWCLGGSADDEDQHLHLCHPGDHVRHRMDMEVRRMGFDTQNVWRVSDINCNYKLCASYPQKILVPIWITDKELENIASFRSWKRIPVVVYRHQRNGAVIARCSQPEISWWGWRNTDDEYLVTSIAKACQMDSGTKNSCSGAGCRRGDDSSDSEFDSSLTGGSCEDNVTPHKLLIMDARSYTAAVANRAKGGGCECEEYYPNCEVVFMGMANIHAIRNSFQALRAVCSQIPETHIWLSALENTRWLQHLSVMLKTACMVCSAVERGRPVLVHCSDGWDRTPQIVALAKILLDPHYRTLEGFQVLVETEWLDFGHKFGDRCGHQENADDVSEQCPVFLQWLDCVHQLLKQFPCLFEFNEAFLVKLVQHTYSCLYGTFLCNNAREREAKNMYKRTCSVWSLLRVANKNFQNFLYVPCQDMVLQPVFHTRALQLWTAVYLPTSSPCTAVDDSMDLYLPPNDGGEELTSRSLDRLPKTRSMDNLVTAFENGTHLTRTSSDPNLNKHCSALQSSAVGGSSDTTTPDSGLANGEEEAYVPSSTVTPEEVSHEETCLTTQPLPCAPLPPAPVIDNFTSCPAPILQQTKPDAKPVPKALDKDPATCRTIDTTMPPTHQTEPCLSLPCAQDTDKSPSILNDRTYDNKERHKSLSHSSELLLLKRLTPLLPMEDSTETLTGEGELPSHSSDIRIKSLGYAETETNPEPGTDEGKGRKSTPVTLPDLSLQGPHWDSVQGFVQSSSASHAGVSRSLQSAAFQSRRVANNLLRSAAVANAVQSCRREANVTTFSLGALPLYSSPSCSPSPSQTPAYLDDDGLPVPVDAVQQRLRQIEASYKQEVEVLRQQVRQLQMRLESKRHSSPPSEPDIDYDDDITCLRESDTSNEDDSLSSHSEDCLSVGSWDRVEPKDTEVTRWVPDHMASHCFNCDSEFWMAKRRHHCRNCGNVFCKDCCHMKLPIPDQQLYDPVLVCSICHDHLLQCRTRDIRSQQLKKPIATASS